MTTDDVNTDNSSSRPNKLYLWNLAAYVLNVAVTYIVGLGFLDLPSNGELSLKYQTLVTPVGWAFSIWGIIFTLQAIWVLIPLFASQQRHTTWITAVGYNYVYVCLAQAAWTLTFANEFIGYSCICMLLILFFLVRLVRPLLPLAAQYKIFQYTLRVAPFTIHMAWILAATFVNLNVFLVEQKVGSVILFYAAVTSLILLFGIALGFLWRLVGTDTVVPAVLAWPLLGIYVELGSPADSIVATFTATEIPFIRYAAAAGAIIIVVGVVVRNVLTMFGTGGNNGGAAAGASRQDVTNLEEGSYLRAHE
jgi:benzodiazapine receptor